jgi:hypothetical protein
VKKEKIVLANAFALTTAILFCYVLVPETKGRTLEQMDHYWQNGQKW